MDAPDPLDTPATPERPRHYRASESQRDSMLRAPPSPTACDAIVASDDITKETALRVQRLVHDMQLAHVQEQDAARRDVEAARNEIALMRLSGAHVQELEDRRSKLAEVDRVLAAQQDLIAGVTRAVEELNAIVPKPKRR